jgi:hypothetical protein
LQQAKLDSLAAEGDRAVSRNVATDGGAGDVDIQFTANGIDPTNDTFHFSSCPSGVRDMHTAEPRVMVIWSA